MNASDANKGDSSHETGTVQGSCRSISEARSPDDIAIVSIFLFNAIHQMNIIIAHFNSENVYAKAVEDDFKRRDCIQHARSRSGHRACTDGKEYPVRVSIDYSLYITLDQYCVYWILALPTLKHAML